MNPRHSAPPVPQVSVIIVNYNAGAFLADCVTAVLASSLQVEVIVSDNGSADDSLQRLRARHGQDPRLTILEHGANLGFAKANNRALPSARAERLLFLNPDCMVQPETLSRMAGFLDSRPDVGMVGCLVRNPDGTEQVASRRSIPDPGIAFKRLTGIDRLMPGLGGRRLNHDRTPLPTAPIEVEAISGSFMFVRRGALDQVGPLDEGYFLHCEDLDWFVRFHQTGWKIALVPNVSVIHHKGVCGTGDPLAVERHKHRGMERFFRKYQYGRYPQPFSALVILGIRIHFFTIQWSLAGGRFLTRIFGRSESARKSA